MKFVIGIVGVIIFKIKTGDVVAKIASYLKGKIIVSATFDFKYNLNGKILVLPIDQGVSFQNLICGKLSWKINRFNLVYLAEFLSYQRFDVRLIIK